MLVCQQACSAAAAKASHGSYHDDQREYDESRALTTLLKLEGSSSASPTPSTTTSADHHRSPTSSMTGLFNEKNTEHDDGRKGTPMSGISLAMVHEEVNTHSCSNKWEQEQEITKDNNDDDNVQDYQGQYEKQGRELPLNLSAQSSAFHDLPPSYPDENQQVILPATANDCANYLLETLDASPFNRPRMSGVSRSMIPQYYDSPKASMFMFDNNEAFGAAGSGDKSHLKMFESRDLVGNIHDDVNDDDLNIKDLLLDFRSFLASV